jgi:FkbM family methyltransferase
MNLPVSSAVSCALLAAVLDVGAPRHRDIFGTEKAQYSQHDEELVIRDFFQDQRRGVFLDVGCGHPIQASNTYYLEKDLGWTGIAVDGLPEMAAKWRRNRLASRFFNFIVTDHADTMEIFHRAELWDVSSVPRPDTLPGRVGVASEPIQVATTTLTRLLDANQVARIDLLSIDIEGHELKALAGFDIERFRPRLVCIEAKPANRAGIAAYFRQHRYEQLERYLAHDLVNYYYAPIDDRR